MLENIPGNLLKVFLSANRDFLYVDRRNSQKKRDGLNVRISVYQDFLFSRVYQASLNTFSRWRLRVFLLTLKSSSRFIDHRFCLDFQIKEGERRATYRERPIHGNDRGKEPTFKSEDEQNFGFVRYKSGTHKFTEFN